MAVFSIGATAWLAAITTSGGIRDEQSQVLADDNLIYRTLLAFAASHHDWSGVSTTIERLQKRTGRTIRLSSTAEPVSDDTRAFAVVDPLAVDPGLVPGIPADRIDPAAAGPFRLTDSERAGLRARAEEVVQCLQRGGSAASLDTATGGGRPRIVNADAGDYADCGGSALDRPTRTEKAALTQLDALVNACLDRAGVAPVSLDLSFNWSQTEPAPVPAEGDAPVRECITAGRKEQLAPLVAPPAVLYVTTPDSPGQSAFALTRPAN